MQPAVTAAIITATVAIITATFTAIRNQRQQHRDQRNSWLHERRKDAYIRFIDATRTFLPLTEHAVRHEVHQATRPTPIHDPAMGCPPPDDEGIVWCEHPHESDFLRVNVDELSDKWHKKAPSKLTELTAAWDHVDMEGPDGLRELARQINELAHWLDNSKELIPLELKEYDPGEGSGPTEAQLLAAGINAYLTASALFRRQAREHLDALTPQPTGFALLPKRTRHRVLR